MNWLIITLAALASFRVSRMICQESGPFYAFKLLREWPRKGSWMHEGLHCCFCVNVWTSALASAFLCWRGYVVPQDFVLAWLGIAGASVALHKSFG